MAIAMQCARDALLDTLPGALYQGLLRFHGEGMLYYGCAVLFPDRLQAWDTVEELLDGRVPTVDMRLDEVADVAMGDVLTVNFKEVGKAPVSAAVRICDEAELAIWHRKLNEALHREAPAPRQHRRRQRRSLRRTSTGDVP